MLWKPVSFKPTQRINIIRLKPKSIKPRIETLAEGTHTPMKFDLKPKSINPRLKMFLLSYKVHHSHPDCVKVKIRFSDGVRIVWSGCILHPQDALQACLIWWQDASSP